VVACPPKTGSDFVREIWHNLDLKREGGISRKQFTTEKNIATLREAGVALAQGMKVREIRAELLSLARGVLRTQDQLCQTVEEAGARKQPPEEGGGGSDLDKLMLREALEGNY
jgi:hypothetical protein